MVWEKEKMLVTSIFYFSDNVNSRLFLQGCQKSLCDKGLMNKREKEKKTLRILLLMRKTIFLDSYRPIPFYIAISVNHKKILKFLKG